MTPPNPVGRPPMKEPPQNQEFVTMDTISGDSIGEASRRAVRMADAKKCPVRFTYQGIVLEANPDEDPWDVGDRWFTAKKKASS